MDKKMTIQQKLMNVQASLKAPKNQFNSFGKYNYRSCEDILEGLKPLLKEVEAVVVLSDEVVMIGERYYIKATATFIDTATNYSQSVSAYAREDENKKGMDLAQVTGSVSSYARKYALNGLFCIDDTKDSDSTNQHGKEEPAPKPENKQPTQKKQADSAQVKNINTITPAQQKLIFAKAAEKGLTPEDVKNQMLTIFKGVIKSTGELSPAQMDELIKSFTEKKDDSHDDWATLGREVATNE